MRRRIVILPVLVLALCLAGPRASASVISFAPSDSTVLVGDLFDVDVVISGLGAFEPPSVGAFDLSVAFDPGILSATGVTFGPFLGDPLSVTDSMLLAGSVDFLEVSLLLPSELDDLQPGSFTLATLSFTAVGFGTTALSFARSDVTDGFGDPLSVTAEDGSVSAVPEPVGVLLLATGLWLVALRSRVGRGRGFSRFVD